MGEPNRIKRGRERRQMRAWKIGLVFCLLLVASAAQLGCDKIWPKKSSPPPYLLSQTIEGTESISAPDGKTIPVIDTSIEAVLGGSEVKENRVSFWGRAVNAKNAEFPQTILMFVNGQFFHSGNTGESRPDVVKRYGNPALLKAGFTFRFPIEKLGDLEHSKVRFFALWNNGVARELNYPKGYRWVGKGKSAPLAKDVSPKVSSPYELLSVPGKGEVIRSSDGTSLPVVTESMRAHLKSIVKQANLVRFSGWAADLKTGQLAQAVLIFVNGKLFYEGKFGSPELWLLENYEYADLVESGFKYEFARRAFRDIENLEVRMFSVWKNDVATELSYFRDYPWGRKD